MQASPSLVVRPPIPVSRPSLDETEATAVAAVLQSGWLGMGQTVREFEDAVQAFLQARHVVAVNTGTSALHLALVVHGIGPGDQVIVPSLTFCATVQAIIAVGAEPVFCEVSDCDLNLDVRHVERLLTRRTRAIMPVHYRGEPCDLDAIGALAGPSGAVVIEDAAHAFGSYYKGRLIGSGDTCACFSFDPIKNVTCGEGGAVVVDDPDKARRLRSLRELGMTRDGRGPKETGDHHEVVSPGFRYHMSNISAAIGLVQLRKHADLAARRRRAAARFDDALAGLPYVRLTPWHLGSIVPFTYVIRVPGERRDSLRGALLAEGIGTRVLYQPNHLQAGFAAWRTGPLPITEKAGREIVCLPLFPDMSEAQIERVIDGVVRWAREQR